MKKTIFLVLLLGTFLNGAWGQQGLPENKFTLTGEIDGLKDGCIVFYGVNSGMGQQDSVVIIDGKFQYGGEVSEPTMVYLRLATEGGENSRKNATYIFVEPGKLKLNLRKGHFEDLIMTGSKTQNEYDALKLRKAKFTNSLKPLGDNYDKLNLEYIQAMKRTKDEDTLSYYLNRATEAKEAMEPLLKKLDSIDKRFIADNPSSYVTAYLMRFKVSGMELAEIQRIYDQMPTSMQNGYYGKGLKDELDKLKRGSPGAKAYMFSSNDINGERLSLADFKGRYVLLDFWASWCVPCRRGNPHLLELYQKYKDKGFEIIGISDDDANHEAWKKAVAKDGIGVWKHVLRGYSRTPVEDKNPNDLSSAFGIHSLPTKILVDPSGVIIGRYGGGGENDLSMDKKLEEIFAIK